MAAPLCTDCSGRPALTWARRGRPKYIKDHPLCEKCHRGLMDSLRGGRSRPKRKPKASPQPEPRDE